MSHDLRSLLGRVSAGAASFTVLTYFVAVATAIALVTFSPLAAQLQSISIPYFFGAFLIYPIFTSTPIDLLLLTDACIVIYVACFIVAFRERTGFISSLSHLREAGRISRSTSWLVAMPFVSSVILIIVLIATPLLTRIGLPSGAPCSPLPACILTPRAFALLAYSPIIEEITFRITPLGVVVSVRSLLLMAHPKDESSTSSRKSVVGIAFISPDMARTRAGLGSSEIVGIKNIHWIEWIAVLVTSVVFGLAHILGPGTSWEPGKAVTAGLSGFFLGTVFLLYGAYAAVLLHWFFDFYLETFEVGANVFGNTFAILGGLISLAILIVGVLSIFVATVWMVRKVLFSSTKEPLGSWPKAESNGL